MKKIRHNYITLPKHAHLLTLLGLISPIVQLKNKMIAKDFPRGL